MEPIMRASSSPPLDQPAPGFEARSTHGPVRLSDFAGRWLVLFSYPADFTPVCGSELAAFAKNQESFRNLRCDVLALSVDPLESHLRWRESLQREHGVAIDFPLIADETRAVAASYGMLSAGADQLATVRALFVIDPDGVLRAMLYYPCSSGRSVAEVLRLVQSLQFADDRNALTPEGWHPGQAAFAIPAGGSAVHAAPPPGLGCVDWYDYERRPQARGAGSGTSPMAVD